MTAGRRIAILGGTGDIGAGLALRWAADSDHRVMIGSRDAERARDRAAEYEAELRDRGNGSSVTGASNSEATDWGDVVVLAVPPEYVIQTLDTVASALGDAILVTPAVAMQRDEAGVHYDPPPAGSTTAAVAAAAPPETPVVGTFHNLPASVLADLDDEFEMDTPVVADNAAAKATVRELAEAINGLGTVDAGPIDNAPEVESVTPVLINVALNDSKRAHVGVRFV